MLPDLPYLEWSFKYEHSPEIVKRNNADTFLEACRKLHTMFQRFVSLSTGHDDGTSGIDFSTVEDRIKDITYKCCLPHDLCYAYGDPGNDIERKQADDNFYSDLITKAGMKKWCAAAFLAAVRLGGTEEFGFSFSWGFAHK
ncbi:MAG: hypothetical protein KKD21_11200 [Proteobacteria bacterium]|nr:hypothetical protein [Pseudomonadota bacterium]MBU1697588.1 hypothetical protein [Pseudomonadota bacterium]